MAFLFRQKTKTDLAKPAKELLLQLWQSVTPSQKTEDELAKLLSQMKVILQGTHDTESSPEQVAQLVNSMIQEDLLYLLAHSIRLLPFESRKDCQSIFSYTFRFKPMHSLSPEPPALTHVVHRRPEVIVELCRGYGYQESAMPCGVVLRELLKQHEDVASIILHDESREKERAISIDEIDPSHGPLQSGDGVFWNFFPWIDGGAFEVSTDAFTTFRELLTRHKALVAIYLERNFELFFSRYNSVLVQSNSYVTKRQSIKLLGETLLDRANYSIMTQYVESGEHLKICMTLLKDDRKMVQYEGFHVFKVFVANPHKSLPVQRILVNNRERLLRFLPTFLEDRTEDEQFTDEKSFLIRQIESMGPLPS
ncbi:MAG: hypothetical protein LQ348_001637 [Seirophora lacunosa]|nr:MAG: hypothetical protein LQ344_002157 [Seirophora lacunosa]KAI4201500.1 MAG: hypothetical protein LQ348_001637 [Seirophora lacunosa]